MKFMKNNFVRCLITLIAFVMVVISIIASTLFNDHLDYSIKTRKLTDVPSKDFIRTIPIDKQDSNNDYTKLNIKTYKTILSSETKTSISNEYTYATFMASTAYIPALEVFLFTLSQTRPKYPLSICIPITNTSNVLIENVLTLLNKYDNDFELLLYI